MATVIRFARHGTKKKPYYRIVVQDKTSPRDGKFIEHIGAFEPLKNDALSVVRDRLEYWLSTGAQMSTSVKNRLRTLRKQWATGASPEAAAPVKATKATKGQSKEA